MIRIAITKAAFEALSPVEITQTPWRYTTLLDAFDHWQTVIAGFVALVAALITVLVTLRVERRKADREIDGLRKSLGVELRQQIPSALAVYGSLERLGNKSDDLAQRLTGKSVERITTRMVESLSRMPTPMMYPANIGKLALLEGDATDVVIVYTLLEKARDGANRLATNYRPSGPHNPGCRPLGGRGLSGGVRICARCSAQIADRCRFA